MTDRSDAADGRAPVTLTGTPVSLGFARGMLHVIEAHDAPDQRRSGNSAAAESMLLDAALARSIAQLRDLAARTLDDDALALLEFQIAMLEDDALLDPARSAIVAGSAAHAAWRAALDAQAADYRAANDAYFAARASDLEDLRDRVVRALTGAERAPVPAGSIVVARDLAPSHFLEIAWKGGGLALFAGSGQSHVATLARARGVPMLVGLSPDAPLPPAEALLDAGDGRLVVMPDAAAVHAFEARLVEAMTAAKADRLFLARPAKTATGERVRVLLNVADFDDLAQIEAEHCDGIGLVRTELIVRDARDIHDEEGQLASYLRLLDWAKGRPVTFRTLDAGGDKPIAGYTLDGETNPFLGVRGVRLSLLHPRVLFTQLRALARAAAVGNVKILVPMIARSGEFDRVRALLQQAVTGLRASGTPCRLPQLGMMVEVPAAALTIDTFAADFFSIGSNDLIAYLNAASRDSAHVASLNDPSAPAVLRIIRSIVTDARRIGREVSLCGDMAGDPRYVPDLLAAGLRDFSVSPATLAGVKATIAHFAASARA